MTPASNYWKPLTQPQRKPLAEIQAFFLLTFPSIGEDTILSQDGDERIQSELAALATDPDNQLDLKTKALALLCLRCRISHFISTTLKKSQRAYQLYKRYFEPQQVLQFLLSDTCKTFVILDDKGKPHYLRTNGVLEPIQPGLNEPFAIRVLRTYRWDSEPRTSFNTWIYKVLPQYTRDVLRGYQLTEISRYKSDWALLSQNLPLRRFNSLAQRERYLLTIFQEIYRRDRLNRKHSGGTSYQPPTEDQLVEMMGLLTQQGIEFTNPPELLQVLQKLSAQLKAWDTPESLDKNPNPSDDGSPSKPLDIPVPGGDPEDIDEQEFLEYLFQQLLPILNESVLIGITQHIERIAQRRQGKLFAPKFLPFLQLFYVQCLSQAEIAEILDFTSGAKVSYWMKPKDLIDWVRDLTITQTCDRALAKAKQQGHTPPDELTKVLEAIRGIAYREIFDEAYAEAFNSKTRIRNSLYALAIIEYVKQHLSN